MMYGSSVDPLSSIAAVGSLGSFLAAVAAIVVAFLAYSQLRLNRKELDVRLRAWIGSSGSERPLELYEGTLKDGTKISPKLLRIPAKRKTYGSTIESLTFEFYFKNYGQIPAAIIRFSHHESRDQQEASKHTLVTGRDEGGTIIMPGESGSVGVTVPYDIASSDFFMGIFIEYEYGSGRKGHLKSLRRMPRAFSDRRSSVVKEIAK